MSKYPPYIQREAGDVASSDDWNRLQELIREEIRQHRHEGESGDTNQVGVLGTQLDNDSLAEGTVDEAAFATGAVTADALQEQAFADWAVAADAAISEKDNLYFDAEAGHDHDGQHSSPLAKASVGTAQIMDNAVTDDKLAQELLDEIAYMELLLSVPQALSVGSAAGSTGDNASYVNIVGHGFGSEPGQVRLLQLDSSSSGEYVGGEPMHVEEWTNNKIRIKLPEDPTGLFQVEVGGIPLNPLHFDEDLVVTDAIPDHRRLDVDVNSSMEITFSTELLVDENSGTGEDEDIDILVLYPGETQPRPLVQNLENEGLPLDLPIEIYYGDNATRLDAALTLSDDRKTITLTHAMPQLPWDTVFAIRVYGVQEREQKPVLVAANNNSPIQDAVTEIRFTTQDEPPAAPVSLRIVPVVGNAGKVISPENIISLATHHAVPIEIETHDTNLPSDWIEIELSDGNRSISDHIPAIGNGATVYITLDARTLEDGPIQVRARAHNATNHSQWILLQGTNPRTRQAVDWVPKDTENPFVRVHPVRSPTRYDNQKIAIDLEPGATVTVQGGARVVTVQDVQYTGRLHIDIPLNPNTTNHLRVMVVDAVGNRSHEIRRDHSGKALAIVHDDTLPELKVDAVRSPTSQRTVTLTGKANEKVTVVATAGGQIATGTADLNRPFRIPFTLAPNTNNQVRLVATDRAGNTSPPVVLTIRHDDQPPPLRLINKRYHRFSGASSSNPRIVVRRTQVAIGGYTEAGATVILSGHGHRVTTQAKGNGRFTLDLPFRLMPKNIHRRSEERTWRFYLDAYDLSGNRTNQRKQITVVLEYRIPSHVRQKWYPRTYWKPKWWRRYRPEKRDLVWYDDRLSNRTVSYYTHEPVKQYRPAKPVKPPPKKISPLVKKTKRPVKIAYKFRHSLRLL